MALSGNKGHGHQHRPQLRRTPGPDMALSSNMDLVSPWSQVEAQVIQMNQALCGNANQGYQHRPQLQQDHGHMDNLGGNMDPDIIIIIIMASSGSIGHPYQQGPWQQHGPLTPICPQEAA